MQEREKKKKERTIDPRSIERTLGWGRCEKKIRYASTKTRISGQSRVNYMGHLWNSERQLRYFLN